MTISKSEWKTLLDTYSTPRQVATETLEALEEQLQPCTKGNKMIVATKNAGKRGLPPFHEDPTICDRGTSGCNLIHNDKLALEYTKMAFKRIVTLENSRKPLPA